jgi:hypothetical protein
MMDKSSAKQNQLAQEVVLIGHPLLQKLCLISPSHACLQFAML